MSNLVSVYCTYLTNIYSKFNLS